MCYKFCDFRAPLQKKALKLMATLGKILTIKLTLVNIVMLTARQITSSTRVTNYLNNYVLSNLLIFNVTDAGISQLDTSEGVLGSPKHTHGGTNWPQKPLMQNHSSNHSSAHLSQSHQSSHLNSSQTSPPSVKQQHTLAELFTQIGMVKYISLFQQQEVKIHNMLPFNISYKFLCFIISYIFLQVFCEYLFCSFFC